MPAKPRSGGGIYQESRNGGTRTSSTTGGQGRGSNCRPSAFRPDISRVGAGRAGVMRPRQSLLVAGGRCCCCHCQPRSAMRTGCPDRSPGLSCPGLAWPTRLTLAAPGCTWSNLAQAARAGHGTSVALILGKLGPRYVVGRWLLAVSTRPTGSRNLPPLDGLM